MFIEDIDFKVRFSEYSKKHYKKKFQKKYATQWEITETAIIESLKRVYGLQTTNRLNCIQYYEYYGLFKFAFSVAGTQKSPKNSGNRIILFLDNEKYTIDILLIYHKEDLEKRQSETEAWKSIIKNNFKTIWKKFPHNTSTKP